MSIQGKGSFDIIIEGNRYRIVELSQGHPDKESARATREKIKKILNNNLEYNKESHDKYSELPKGERVAFLKSLSQSIKEEYLPSTGKASKFVRKIMQTSVRSPESILELPAELIQKILEAADIADVKSFSLTSHEGRRQALTAIKKYAQNSGYIGDDELKAYKYVKELFRALDNPRLIQLIPKEYRVDRPGSLTHLDIPATLQKLKSSNTGDIFNIFSNEESHRSENKNLARYFLKLTKDGMIAKVTVKDMDSPRDSALYYAVRQETEWGIELLIQNGCDPNTLIEDRPLVTIAADAGHLPVVKYLVQNGARLDIGDRDNATPLHFAATHRAREDIVQFLLEHGAPINVQALKSRMTPLFYAIYATNSPDMVDLLLKYNPDLTLKNSDGLTALQWIKDRINHMESYRWSYGDEAYAEFMADAEDIVALLEGR